MAIRVCTPTTRPASRTLSTRASAATNVYGPASSGRVRNASTCSSSSLAMIDTCDLKSLVTPSVSTRRSIRRWTLPADSRWPPRWSTPAQRVCVAPIASPGNSCPDAAWEWPHRWCRRGCRNHDAGSRCDCWTAHRCAGGSRPADGVGFRAHQGVDEHRQQPSQQVRAGLGELVGQQLLGVDKVW
ncbi:transposase [Mycobacterium xenopi 3993]|nr:transposase [Mycobacterium xenopi 3993]